MTTWTIGINWKRDGDFSDANEDVTSLLIFVTWFLGMRQPWRGFTPLVQVNDKP